MSLVEEQVQAGASAASSSLLDEIMAQARITPVDEGYSVAKQGVAALIANILDSGATSGIAITSTLGNGGWQYSTDSGANWFNIGTTSGSSALLLAATAQVRYVPDSRNGETASLAFKAWDQTSATASVGDRTAASAKAGIRGIPGTSQ